MKKSTMAITALVIIVIAVFFFTRTKEAEAAEAEKVIYDQRTGKFGSFSCPKKRYGLRFLYE